MATSSTLLFLLLIASPASIYLSAGLNCSIEDCDDKPPCPPDSLPSAESSGGTGGGGCRCAEERCAPRPPACPPPSTLARTHEAAGVPGDCCHLYSCLYPQGEVNCSGVVCPKVGQDCPDDSYRLPNSQTGGECCSKPQGCACLPGPCVPPACPAGQSPVVLRPGNGTPASCCPIYQCQSHLTENLTCSVDGKEIISGTKWKKTDCLDCYCQNGELLCAPSVTCPPLPPHCPATRMPQGECCPICVFNHNERELLPIAIKPGGCKSAKGFHLNGAAWREDDCTNCTCVDGAAKCQAEMCHQTCANATHVMGECCPRCNVELNCPALSNCNLTCKHGLLKDHSGCPLCICREEEECHLKCASGFLKDGSGKEICECASECPPLSSCSKKCKHGFKTNKAGCEVSPDDNNNASVPEGTPEKECITDNGIKRDEGEVWFDNCRQCYCYEGKEMCSLISCPKVDCPDPKFSKDSCCPSCSERKEDLREREFLCLGPGGIRREVESWREGCLDCICHNGSVLCHSEPCPPVLCQHPLRGDCCPVCPPQEYSQPVPKIHLQQSCGDKKPGEKWRQSECTSCICINGEAVCYTQSCGEPDFTCKRQVQLKNHCCPLCMDNLADDKICQVGNVTFNIGEEWEPDKCTRCSCGPAHTISCTQTICERPCSKMDNPCCPKCKEVEGSYDWRIHAPLYLILICLFLLVFGVGSVLLWRKHSQSRRHQLKICQPVASSYHYKYVPTYEQSTALSPHKSPV